MYLLGYDVGSSSVKASLLDGVSGKCIATDYFPKTEMPITAHQIGWAEQDPEMWWQALKMSTQSILNQSAVNKNDIKAIGISYQMHGLVCIDKARNVLRPSIIWCDSRAVSYGQAAFNEIGTEKCLGHLLNSPGNFTASKLKWIKENEPSLFSKIDKIMLPGDYIAMRLSGQVVTTISGLSEGILWDFKNGRIANFLLETYGFDDKIIPTIAPTFGEQGQLSEIAANELGLAKGTSITYRAGDQPNNALSLNVMNTGEIAATAGTSGVIYGVSDQIKYDAQSRVNTFAHVNHTKDDNRLGVLLCINGTGILYAWLHRMAGNLSYDRMNALAAQAPIGSEGALILPYGNGAERVLNNQNIGCQLTNINFNIHTQGHLFRAAQEGIVFSLKYGLDIMKTMGIQPSIIRAGHANLFLSPLFRSTLSNLMNLEIELYDTDGSQGAARGAGIGLGHYTFENAFDGLAKIKTIVPDNTHLAAYQNAYQHWLKQLEQVLTNFA